MIRLNKVDDMTRSDEGKVARHEIWSDDKLGRLAEAEWLISFLLNRVAERKAAKLPASFVLNIDSQWGQGKSFFLDRLAKTLTADGYLVAIVNAWKDDHAEDPLLSVMDAIDAAVAPLVKKEKQARDRWNQAKRVGGAVAVAAMKGAVSQIAKKAVGSGIEELGEIANAANSEKIADSLSKDLSETIAVQGKKLLERFREGKRTIESFRSSIDQFLRTAEAKSQALPLFVLVDELDRCRPPFAIAMLERIKHLFDIDSVVFVVATDTNQLSHSVAAVYGSGFGSARYLSRFFNRTYIFARVPRTHFVAHLMTNSPLDEAKISLPPNTELPEFISQCFDFFGLPLRDIEQSYEILRTVITAWTSRARLELVVLLPLIIAFQQKFTIELNGKFSEQMSTLASINSGSKDGWHAKFYNQRFNQEPDIVSCQKIANEFGARMNQTLDQIDHDGTTSYARWVANQLGDEFARAHNNGWTRGSPPKSIILGYPDLIKSAGRLVPPTPSDGSK